MINSALIFSISDVVLSFEMSEYTVAENVTGGQLEVCIVIINGTLERDVRVNVTSADGTAEGTFITAYKCYMRLCI